MIVDLRTIHQFYRKEIDKRVNKIKDNLYYQKDNRKIVEKQILNNRKIIDIYLNVKHEDILSMTDPKETKSIKYPIVPIYFEGRRVNFEAIRLYVDNYVWINKNVVQLESKLKELINNSLSLEKFSFIIKSGNSLLIDRIVEDNYTLEPNRNFGTIGVVANSSKKKRVNWGESNKKKQEIIDRGGIPYYKEEDLNNEEYKGEEWLIYHEDLDFFLHWERSYAARQYNPVLSDYAYKPARGDYGIINKFNIFKRDRERAKRTYIKLGHNERVSLSIK
jgi:hypothetical protein